LEVQRPVCKNSLQQSLMVSGLIWSDCVSVVKQTPTVVEW